MFKKILLLSLLSFSITFSQSKNVTLVANARAQKNRILIRWAVNNPIEWKRANKTGYFLTRYVVKRNNIVLQKPEKKDLTTSPLIPAKLDDWKDIAQKDNHAAIIAQALYGDSFQVSETKESKVSKMFNIADELDQRHTFGLFAAEQNFEAAKLAGWGFEDKEVKENEMYVYQISVPGNKKIKPVSVAISLSEYDELPKVKDFTALGDDKKILLVWDYKTYERTYSSYKIERSEDGKNFEYITKTPIVQVTSGKKQQKRMYFADTIFKNEKAYHYRIHGITSFGEDGPRSSVISTKGVPDVFYSARVVDYKIDKKTISLEWEFPKDFENQIDGFQVHHAPNDNGPYKIISKDLTKEDRKFSHESDFPSNYYKIGVVGKNKKVLLSQSTLVQPIDSLPPSVPKIIEKTIDSTGVVKIKFAKNSERDFLGYRVYKANNNEEEFVDLFNKPYTKPEFIEKVNLKLMTDKVYYKFMSEDKRHNLSEFSEIIEFKKPDKIPPTAPVFKNYTIDKGVLKIYWTRSYSDDVVSQIIERKKKTENNWVQVFKTKNEIEEFTDSNLENNTDYQYRIKAVDDVGLTSDVSSSIITLRYRDNTPQKVIMKLEGIANRETKKILLSWQINPKTKNIDNIQIYKNKLGEKPALIWEGSKLVTTFQDKLIYPNNEYEYFILTTSSENAVFKTESIKVSY